MEIQLPEFAETISDAFVSLDSDWRYVYVNERAGRMLGRSSAELVGKHIWTEFPEGIGQPFHRAYERAMNERKAITIEAHYPPWDRWFENRIRPTDGGGLVIFFVDVTDRHRAAEESGKREQELALSNRLSAVEQEAAEVGHEVNNVLTAIIGHADLAQRAVGARDEAHAVDALEKLIAATQRAAKATRKLLRLNSSGTSIPVDLPPGPFIAGMLPMLRRLAGDGIEVTFRDDSDRATVRIDPVALEQVIMNLMSNSVHAAKDGGEVKVSVWNDADVPFVRIRVEDDGRGMSTDTAARVFEPFFTTKGPDKGTGLGLLAVRHAVQSAGGHIEVHSVENEGTEITIGLPRRPNTTGS